MNSAPTNLVIARLAAAERPDDIRASKAYDQFFGFASVSLMLFVPQLKSLTPLLLLVLLAFHCVWRREDLPRLLRASSLYLLLPLFAVTSFLWSIDPQSTRYYGFQFLITAFIGCIIGAGLDRRAAMRGVFLAFAVYAFSSLVFGRSVSWGGGAMGNSAFAGLAQAKNTAGDTAAVGVIFSLSILFDSLERRQRGWALLAFLALGVQMEMLIASRSSGALLAVGIAIPLFFIWNFSRIFEKAVRMVTAITAIVAIATAVITQHIWLPPLVEYMSRAMGKDSTLTGRTYLWDRAAALVQEKPLLGLGYNAFWRKGNLDAEGLWRYAGITSRSGFNFHSTPTELLVHLGYVGVGLFALVFIGMAITVLMRTMIRPNAIMIGWCTLLTYEVVRMPFESIGTGPFHYTTSLLAAGMVVSVGWLARDYRPEKVASRPARFRGERHRPAYSPRAA